MITGSLRGKATKRAGGAASPAPRRAQAGSTEPKASAARGRRGAEPAPRGAARERERERELKVERLEEICRTLELRAEASERAQREAISTISHDLRNPLSVILVSSRMLIRSLGPGAPGHRQIDAIVRAADEINQLAQDMVDALTIERGALRVERDAQEVEPIVDLALDAVSHAVAAKPIELARELPRGLPQIAGDRERLAQALVTLLANAVRFTPKGGRITVRAEPWGGGARFSVADTGPGVPADQRATFFQRFSTTRRSAGQLVGLGPFVAKGIIEAHGGAIWAESAPGLGTTVFFTIPAAEPRSALAAAT